MKKRERKNRLHDTLPTFWLHKLVTKSPWFYVHVQVALSPPSGDFVNISITLNKWQDGFYHHRTGYGFIQRVVFDVPSLSQVWHALESSCVDR